MPPTHNTTRHVILQRIPILLATLASLVPLIGLIDFGTNWVHSVAFAIIYSAVCFVELGLLIFKQELTTLELYVCSIMQISAFTIATIYFQNRYTTGKDSKQEFISNIIGMVVAIVAEIYQVIRDCQSNDDKHDTNDLN